MSILSWKEVETKDNWVYQTMLNVNLRIDDLSILNMSELEYVTDMLPLQAYYFVFYNYNPNNYDVCCFRILNYTNEFLFGPHLIEWNSQVFWVSSLSCLKREFFHINDRISLEKSLYLLCPAMKKSIQVREIRDCLVLQQEPIEYPIYVYYSPRHQRIRFESKQVKIAWNMINKARLLAGTSWRLLLHTLDQSNASTCSNATITSQEERLEHSYKEALGTD